MRSIQSVFARSALPATAQVRRAACELYAWGDAEFQSVLAGVLLHEPVADVALLAQPLAAELKTAPSPRVQLFVASLCQAVDNPSQAAAALEALHDASTGGANARLLLDAWPTCHPILFASHSPALRLLALKLVANIFRDAAAHGTPLAPHVTPQLAAGLLGLFTDEDALVRGCMAHNVSLFFVVIAASPPAASPLAATAPATAATAPINEDAAAAASSSQQHDDVERWALLRLVFSCAKDNDNLGAFMAHLRDAVRERADMRYTLLQAVGSIGCAANVKFTVRGAPIGLNALQWALHVLAEQWAAKRSRVDLACAVEQLRRIAAAQRASDVRALFDSVKAELYPNLFSTLLGASQSTAEARDVLARFLLDVFGDDTKTSVADALNKALPVLLPSLLRAPDLAVLGKVAELVYPNAQASSSDLMRKLIITNLSMWIVHLVDLLARDEVRGKEVWKRVVATATYPFKELLQTGCKTILKSVVLRLVDKSGAVDTAAENALKVLARSTRDDREVEGLVKHNFMFLLCVLSERVQENWTAASTRRQALRCVGRLLELMGNSETVADALAPKVLPTLRAGLEVPELQSAAVQSLRVLTGKLSGGALRDNIGVIVVSLLPCLGEIRAHFEPSQSQRSSQDDAVKLLAWLIIDRRAALEKAFHDVQELLPPHPALADVARVLSEHVGQRTHRQRLAQLANLITNESDAIRLMALLEMHNVLRDYGHEVRQALLAGHAETRDLVSSVLGALLKAARSGGARVGSSARVKEMRLACCKCLGELGAVDPARLNLTALDEQIQDAAADLFDEKGLDYGNRALAAALLANYLVQALRSAPDPASHVHIGFAVQELIKFFKSNAQSSVSIVGGEDDAGMIELQDLVNADVLATIRPFAFTNYDFEGRWMPPEPSARDGTTFFGPGVAFATSVGDWVANLANRSRGPQGEVFRALRGLRASDSATRTLLFVLPYVVQNVLVLGDASDAEAIRAEVRGVLHDCSSGAGGGNGGNAGDEEASGAEQGRVQLSVQAIFVLLDTLGKWESRMSVFQRAEQGRAARYAYAGDFDDKRRLTSGLLKHISHRELAEAAFRCGAFARALMYFERHLRARHARDVGGGGVALGAWRADERVQFARDEIEFLHKIFAALDTTEPDGLEGVARVRAQHDGGVSTGVRLGRVPPPPPALPAALEVRAAAQPTLVEQIGELEHASKWDEALLCYEEAIALAEKQGRRDEVGALHDGQLRCLGRAGHHELLVSLAEGKLVRRPWLKPVALPYTLDALWRLGRWDDLSALLQSEGAATADYTQALACAVLHTCKPPAAASSTVTMTTGAKLYLEQARLMLLEMLSAASMESYERAYPLLVRLHAVTELERGAATPQVDAAWWKARLRLTAPVLALRDEVLAVRRAVFRTSAVQWPLEVDSWLALAKTARTCGDTHACESALLKVRRAVEQQPPLALGGLADSASRTAALWRARVLRAEMLRDGGELHAALQALEPAELGRGVAAAGGGGGGGGGDKAGVVKARTKALLLSTRLMSDSGLVQGQAVVENFKTVNVLRPNWEQGHFYLAKYLDTLLQNTDAKEDAAARRARVQARLPGLMEEYGAALKAGQGHLFETLPRLLTLWYNYADALAGPGATIAAAASTSKLKRSSTAAPGKDQVHAVMRRLADELPARLWYSSMAQLVSRVCHASAEVWELTRAILVKVLLEFPAQALWQVLGVAQSRIESRRERASQVVDELVRQLKGQPRRSEQVNSARGVFELFIKLATAKTVDKQQVLEVGQIRDVSVLLGAVKNCRLVVPTQGGLLLGAAAEDETPPLLCGLGPRAEIMQSKEKPKKMMLLSDGGTPWTFLCKNERNGDLRKDSRLMEFNQVVNQLFARDAQAGQRKLRLRTYAVVCLNEECGLLEWVGHTLGYRASLAEVYAHDDDVKSMKNISTFRQRLADVQLPGISNSQRLQEYHRIVDEFPPRFHRWFLHRFADPAAWLAARTCYTRSLAAWSMVGHVVGLGDRHAENILLCVKSGECVHVDFDCLFDKGLNLLTPEIVPFRLTHNMVDALGLTGVEGPFRRSCEVSLGVLRVHKDLLLSVLDSFVADPLVEWSRRDKDGNADASKELSSQEARRKAGKGRLDNIEERLSGISRNREQLARGGGGGQQRKLGAEEVHGFDTVPLSTQGQVQRLIDEAIDEDKLSRMFVGWCPWL